MTSPPAARSSSAILRFTPLGLTALRLLLGPLIVFIAWHYGSCIALGVCVIVGVLSDIFDGIIARRLGVATPALRRFDSAADVVFFICILCAMWLAQPRIVRDHAWGIGALLALEVVCQIVSFAKFGRPPATHSYCAKCWGLFLCASCTAVLSFGWGGWLLLSTIVLGCVADVEVISIMLLMPKTAVDVPTIVHAIHRRRAASAHREKEHSLVSVAD